MGAPPRLTAEQVADARRQYDAGAATWKELAAKYQVSVSGIKHAISGRTWATMTDPPPVRRQPHVTSSGGPARILTEQQVAELVELRDTEGLTWAAIGRRYVIDRSVALRTYRRATEQRPAAQEALPAQRKPIPRQKWARDLSLRIDRRLFSAAWSDLSLDVQEVARLIGYTPDHTRRLAHIFGLPTKREMRTVGLRRTIGQLWSDDSLSQDDIAAALGISKPVVQYHARMLGLDSRAKT